MNEHQRLKLLDGVDRLVRAKLFDPKINGVDWSAYVEEARPGVATAAGPTMFELKMNQLRQKIGLSHLGFFHEGGRTASGKAAVGVTFTEDWEPVHPKGFSRMSMTTVQRRGPASNLRLPLHRQPQSGRHLRSK